MTVTAANETARTGYTATGGETTFDYTFEIAAAGDLAVERNGVVLPTSHYSVAGAGTEDGGTITLSSTYYPSGATAADTWVLYRNMSLTRSADYQTAGDFKATTVNSDFDRLWQAMQQVARQNLYSLAFPISDTLATGDNNIPAKASRLGKYLYFDATNGLPTAVDLATTALAVTAFAQTLLDDTTAAEARATLGLGNIDLDTFDGIFTVSGAENPWSGDGSTDTSWMDGIWITRGLYWDDTYKMLSRVEANKDEPVMGFAITPGFPFETFGAITQFRIQGTAAMLAAGNTPAGSIPDRLIWPVAGSVGGFEIADLSSDEGQKVFGGSVLERDGDGATHGYARLIFKKIADDGTTETWFQGEQQNAYADANSATEATDADVNAATSIRWGVVTTVTKATKVITGRTYIVDHGAASAGAVTWTRIVSVPITAGLSYGEGTTCELSPFAVNTETVQAHGCGATPSMVVVELVCLSDEHGYVAGDVIEIGAGQQHASGTNAGFTILKDATNVTMIIQNAAALTYVRRDTRANVALTSAKWKIRARPYLFS